MSRERNLGEGKERLEALMQANSDKMRRAVVARPARQWGLTQIRAIVAAGLLGWLLSFAANFTGIAPLIVIGTTLFFLAFFAIAYATQTVTWMPAEVLDERLVAVRDRGLRISYRIVAGLLALLVVWSAASGLWGAQSVDIGPVFQSLLSMALLAWTLPSFVMAWLGEVG